MQYIKNVSTLKLNSDKCTGCGICLKVCPHEVFVIRNKLPRPKGRRFLFRNEKILIMPNSSHAIKMAGFSLAQRNKKAAIVLKDSCMECGACAKNCAFKALSVRPGVGCAAGIMYAAFLGKDPEKDACC